MKYKKMEKREFIKRKRIKENLKQKICPFIFCVNSRPAYYHMHIHFDEKNE